MTRSRSHRHAPDADTGPTPEHSHHAGHHHHHGVKGFLHGIFVPHSHDVADAIDDAMEASTSGIRALKVSLVVLLVTAGLQLAIVLLTDSVALLADTIHNVADALTAVPLWIAFVLGRRVANRRFTYGYGRAEDLAGMVIVCVIALSAALAAWEAVDRLIHPSSVHDPWILLAAGLVGFTGNETVAIYRIRVGQKIGSAALVADGIHARIDGFTSLAVVLGAAGVLLGFPLADPIVGLLISASILVLLWSTVRSIGSRLMDAIDPDLLSSTEDSLAHTEDVIAVRHLRLRWVGHRLQGSATLVVTAGDLHQATHIADRAVTHLKTRLKTVDDFTATPVLPDHHQH